MNDQPSNPPTGTAGDRPAWVDQVQVVGTLDARQAIAAGEHPLAQVMAAVAMLTSGQAYRLITPFVPAPLLDKARAQGLQVWTHDRGAGEIHNLLARLDG
jgi:hypothetical protein